MKSNLHHVVSLLEVPLLYPAPHAAWNTNLICKSAGNIGGKWKIIAYLQQLDIWSTHTLYSDVIDHTHPAEKKNDNWVKEAYN